MLSNKGMRDIVALYLQEANDAVALPHPIDCVSSKGFDIICCC
jgi:hypothetical protein